MSKENSVKSGTRRKRLWAALAYVAIGMLSTLLLAGLKLVFEHTNYGRETELWAFGKLQGSLSEIDPDIPIVMLDIGDLAGGKPGQPTPRAKLREIVEALAVQEPRAIAVDVDFSPERDRFATPGDQDFFDACLRIKNDKGTPVFLAVGKRKAAYPEAWLGQKEYAGLAVAAPGNKYNTSKIPLWVRAQGSSANLNTMSYALALEYRKHLPEAPDWIRWAVDANVEEPAAQTQVMDSNSSLSYGARFVNYSKLEQLKTGAQTDTTAEAVKQTGHKYNNRLVILGDLSNDLYPVPGRQINEPGSLLIASAKYTLIREPLFEFKPVVQFLLDFVIAGFIIITVATIRYRNPDSHGWGGNQALFIYAAIIGIILSGWLLVSLAGVLWLDFLLVAFALFLHPKLEHGIGKFVVKIAGGTNSEATKPLVTNRSAVCVLMGTLLWSSNGTAQEAKTFCRDGVAAVVLKLKLNVKYPKRTCYFREKKGNAEEQVKPWQKLAAADNNKKPFEAGEDVSCDEGCSIVLLLCDIDERFTVTETLPDHYTVIHSFKTPSPSGDPYPHNLMRTAQVFTPPDPKSSESRVWVANLYESTPSASESSVGLSAMMGSRSRESGTAANKSREKTADEKNREEEQLAELAMADRATSSTTSTSADNAGNAVRRTNDSARTLTSLLVTSNAARRRKDYSLAERGYLQAGNLAPTDARAFQGLGNVYVDQGKWLEAEKAYRRALTLNPYFAEVYLSLAYVLLQPADDQAKRLQEAESIVWHAATIDPRNEKAYDLLEQILEERGASLAEFESSYRRALALSPFSVKESLRLSRVLRRLGREEDGDEFLRRAEKEASRLEELRLVAEEFAIQHKYPRAQRLLQRALKINSHQPQTLSDLGRVAILRKHYAEALNPLKRAVALAPGDFAPSYLLGIAQFNLGSLVESEEAFDHAAKGTLNGEPAPALAYWFTTIGDSYAKFDRISDSIRLYNKALRYDADNVLLREKISKARARPK